MRPDLTTRRTKAIAIVALPVLLVAAFALASYTALFHVREVRIDGAATLSRDEVLTLAGVGPGTNVFHLDTDAIAASLEADPWVASATVERHLPGTVVIGLRGGSVVRYGGAGEDAAKAAALRAVLAWAADQGEALRDIDVTVPQTPSATLADGSTVTP